MDARRAASGSSRSSGRGRHEAVPRLTRTRAGGGHGTGESELVWGTDDGSGLRHNTLTGADRAVVASPDLVYSHSTYTTAIQSESVADDKVRDT